MSTKSKSTETIIRPASQGSAEPTATTISKASIARKIYTESQEGLQSGKIARKDVIQRFIAEAKLTKAGASTYYQNFRAKAKQGQATS